MPSNDHIDDNFVSVIILICTSTDTKYINYIKNYIEYDHKSFIWNIKEKKKDILEFSNRYQELVVKDLLRDLFSASADVTKPWQNK